MRLTRQAEIAVQVLALCASPGRNAAVTTRDAAAFARTTKDHAAQVVARLVRGGFLESARGRNGGIRLARAAGEIRLGAVMRLMEPVLDGASCGEGERSAPVSGLHALHRSALGSFLSVFDDFTVADLAGDPATSRIACLECDLHAIARQGRAGLRLRGYLPGGTLARDHLRPDSACNTAHRVF